ncbi:hypothetical protein GOEFS_047_00160 [Gordonia effusa NBRC 100432]|uniref:Rhodanese domain-containing protein n=1 Tax=Gordonia effusa NBRC 100432 TaxID=1077974 RepID=H0QZA6_9ACTN|nr:hypothetical protein [Gordonia effusa]GAB18157.1 hypothetical protein GOEFS_047_00160 [Gordonia effusa NBRC 100432]
MTAILSAPLSSDVAPLSVLVRDYHRHLAAGVIAVDIRDQQTRDRDGVLLGAIAISADVVLDRLTPGGAEALRIAGLDRRWLLISDDGHDAEWLAWHLQARGVIGARFVVGGYQRMRSAGINGPVSAAELAMISAH